MALNLETAMGQWAGILNTSSLSRTKLFPLPPPQMHIFLITVISLEVFFLLDIPSFQSWEKKKKQGKKAGDISEVKLASWQLIYEVLKSIFGAVIYLKALSLNKQRAPLPNYSYSRNNPKA